MVDSIPDDPHEQVRLMEKWASLNDFSGDDRPDEPGAWNLVYNLRSIEESCRALLDTHLPNLADASEERALVDALNDTAIELTHLLWHVRDIRYYGDLAERVLP